MQHVEEASFPLGLDRPLAGYILNGLFVTAVLLLVANILNIALFPSLSEVQIANMMDI